MRAFWDRVVGVAVGGVVAALMVGWFALDLYGCVAGTTQGRFDECEQAYTDYVTGNEPRPAIITEEWCFDHLTGQG